MSDYDSRSDTIQHMRHVSLAMSEVSLRLHMRAEEHDASKLQEPEKSAYDKYTPLLRNSVYGTDEYKRLLGEMGPALQHHYAHNRHHPEHHESGVSDMSLLDLLEMLADWRAASHQHGGDLAKGLEINRRRFEISDELYAILERTADEMGWLPS